MVETIELFIGLDEGLLSKVGSILLGPGHAENHIEDGLLIRLNEHGICIHVTIQNG